jgi:hypothetical protein
MLPGITEFPQAGSTAYVAPLGEKVRIVQRMLNGSFMVARYRDPAAHKSASDTYRAEPDQVFATVEAALGIREPKRRRRV